MQNSDIVTSKTDKLFLLPNAAARLKRKNGGFDLTSAGLMSLIAACGGSSGGSADTDTNTDTMGGTDTTTDTMGGTDTTTDTMGGTDTTTDTMGGTDTTTDTMGPDPDPNPNLTIYDISGLAPAIVSSADVEKIKPPFTTAGTPISATVTMDAKNISIDVPSSTNNRLRFVLKEDGAIAENDFTVTAVDKDLVASQTIYKTTSLEMGYGNLDADSKSELIFASQFDFKGALVVIWNYDPTDTKFQGKTFNLIENDPGSVGDDYGENLTPDNASINHLRIEQNDTVYNNFFAKDRHGVWVKAADLGANSTALFVGVQGEMDTSPSTKIKTSAVFVVWDVDDYADKTDTVTLGATSVENKSFIISGKDDYTINHGFTKALDLGNDGKMDLLLADTTSVHIIWDIASYKGGSSTFDLGSNSTDNFFSIRASSYTDFLQSTFSSIDLDGDGYNDLYSNHKGGIIIWGSELAAKPTDSISLDDWDTATMFAGTSADPADGLWIGGANNNQGAPLLGELRDTLWFVDVDGDGFRDAVSQIANTAGNYDWWKLAGTQNIAEVISTAGSPYVKFGDTIKAAASQTEAQLNALGIYPGYFKQDLDKDGKPDFISLAANTGDATLHNVWLGKDDGSLDATTNHDAYARPPAASSLADGSEMFQLVDIA